MSRSTSEAAQTAIPQHIAIVMDGNGRWASKRFLPRVAGHRQGIESLRRAVKACVETGVKVLTVFAFSSENWKRPADEVSGIMGLMIFALEKEVSQLHADGIRLRFLGDLAKLSPRVQQGLAEAQHKTAANTVLELNVCFNYGGRWDVVQAARSLAERGEAITEESIARNLCTADCGDPDLMIRTGGEMRISNFLIWQAAYCELFFSKVLWPDFDRAAFDEALSAYAARERRFGMVSAQLAKGEGATTSTSLSAASHAASETASDLGGAMPPTPQV